ARAAALDSRTKERRLIGVNSSPLLCLEAVELDGVLVQQLLLQWLWHALHDALDGGLRVGPAAGRMWVVGRPHRLVGLDDTALDHLHAGAILDERHPDLPLEVLARG